MSQQLQRIPTREILAQSQGDPLRLLTLCGGFYECPKKNGQRFGPLVGYTGRYEHQGKQLQYVGDVYANFAKIERRSTILHHVAMDITHLPEVQPLLNDSNLTFVGAPEGGKTLASSLSTIVDGNYVFPEKKVTALATPTSREVSKLYWGRHEIEPGERCIITEDIANNFSTTREMIELILAAGGEVVAMICFLNRSLVVDNIFSPGDRLPDLRVISLVHKPFAEYHQDDPEVASYITADSNNVVWSPKKDWARLQQAMLAG